jgi:hypothetical protein
VQPWWGFRRELLKVTTNENDPLSAVLKTLAARSDVTDAQIAALLKRVAELEAELVAQNERAEKAH